MMVLQKNPKSLLKSITTSDPLAIANIHASKDFFLETKVHYELGKYQRGEDIVQDGILVDKTISKKNRV